MTDKQVDIELAKLAESRLNWEESRQQWHDDFLLRQRHWMRQQIMWTVAIVALCLTTGIALATYFN